jgi:hypothetical protein
MAFPSKLRMTSDYNKNKNMFAIDNCDIQCRDAVESREMYGVQLNKKSRAAGTTMGIYKWKTKKKYWQGSKKTEVGKATKSNVGCSAHGWA